MASAKSGQKRQPTKVTPMDRLRWSREVARLKSDGMTWPEVARATGLTQAKCRRLWAQLKESGDPDAPVDAWGWVYRRRDALTITLEEAAATYAAAEPGSQAAVAALRLWEQTSDKMLELARWVGWTPRQLAALTAENAMQEMFRELARIVERYDVPSEAIEEMLALAERRLSGAPGGAIDTSATAA